MIDLLEVVERVTGHLRSAGRPWALVGGLAVSARAEPRFTADLDFAVSVADDTQAEAVCLAFRRAGYAPVTVIEHARTGRLATARHLAAGVEDPLFVDLLFASCGIEDEITAAATNVELVPGLVVPVASAPHLVAMKVLARDDDRRPRDREDLRGLLRVVDDEGMAVARAALARIAARGYGRGRDLLAELEGAVATLR